MRKMVVFLMGLIFILGIITALSLLLPSRVSVVKSLNIEAPREKVYQVLSDFETWPQWFPPLQDNVLDIHYSAESSAITARDASGNTLTLEKIDVANDTLNIRVVSGSASRIQYQFVLLARDTADTQVFFNVNTYFKWYPWEKIKGVVSDKMAGPYYQNALSQLKKFMEKSALESSPENHE